jgi:guanyl-specific ribonuclease Sa
VSRGFLGWSRLPTAGDEIFYTADHYVSFGQVLR